MREILKKTWLAGLGLASLTREKAEELVDELVRRGEISEKERPHALEDLLARVKEEQKRFSSAVKEAVQRVVAEMGLPSRQQLEELKSRVEKLEQAAHSHQTPGGNDPSV